LKSGATDYVLKQNLTRLIPTIRRALAESQEHARRQAAERALRTSEEEFRAFFQTAAVCMTETGLDRRFVRVNDCFCRLTGYSREKLLQLTPSDLELPEDRAENERLRSDFVSGRTAAYNAEERYVRKDGQMIWVQVTASMVNNATGQPLRS